MAEVRQYKLARMTEKRNTCPYCSVACGVLMYGLGDGATNDHARIMHIAGDPAHPVNQGTLCPKGAGLTDYSHSPTRLKCPQHIPPVSQDWNRISWGQPLDRPSRSLKG